MPANIVVNRNRRARGHTSQDFMFTREMVPGLSNGGVAPEFIKDYRAKAWQTYENLKIPVTSEEAWRRTDLKFLPASQFRLYPDYEGAVESLDQPPSELLRPLADDAYGGQIVLMPGKSQITLNQDLAEKEVIFTDLQTAEKQYPHILSQVIGQTVEAKEGKFAALAGAMAQSGILLYVPQGVELELPLHSIFWGPGSNLAHFSHLLIWLDKGASATYVHEFASSTHHAQNTLHAGIVEIRVDEGARLRFVELQSWGDHVWNFNHERASVGRNANLDWIFGAIGSRLTKNFSDLELVGQGAEGRMSGFYFTDGKQHMDHDTQQNHRAPNTTSDLLFKGALRDQSRSVWQGMIYVAPGAQKTDGYQANRNLVLSSESRADSIPGLEILADDVRCTHGATVGKIDPDQLFYLNSRGIPRKEAERLIVQGFFDPIMARIPFSGVRERFQNAIIAKMG